MSSADASKPSVAMVGPGGVGSYFAAHLTNTGVDVLSCARRPFDTYRIDSDTSPMTVPARVETDPADVASAGPVDFLMVAVKAHQTEGASAWLEALAGPDTVVVAVQNGVEAVERMTPWVHGAEVLPAVVYCGAELQAPGHAEHIGQAQLTLPDTDAAHRFAALWDDAWPTVKASPDHAVEAWFKLAVNVVFNGMTCITNRTMEVLTQETMRSSVVATVREVFAVGRAEGVPMDEAQVERFMGLIDHMPRHGLTSMLQDRRARRAPETDAIHHAVGRIGARHGIAAPLSTMIGVFVDSALAAERDPSITF